jgi:cytochrome c553
MVAVRLWHPLPSPEEKVLMRERLAQAFAVFALAAGGAAQAADIEAGRLQAATCMGCHGVPSYTNVYPSYHVPKLGGQHADYIVAALQAYKSGQRPHKTMQAQAASLSDEDMRNIAAYFASLTP